MAHTESAIILQIAFVFLLLLMFVPLLYSSQSEFSSRILLWNGSLLFVYILVLISYTLPRFLKLGSYEGNAKMSLKIQVVEPV